MRMAGEPRWTPELLDELLAGRWVRRVPFGADNVALGRKSASAGSLVVAISDETLRKYMGGANFVYFAKPGESFDGHEDAYRAATAGNAVALIVERELPVECPQLVVDDAFLALELLASHRRSLIRARVVAMTGTVGKTSTMTAMKAVFGDRGIVLSTNNVRRAIALNMANAPIGSPEDTIVAEVSVSALWDDDGGISKVLRPDVAVLTHVGLGMTHRVPTEKDTAIEKSKIINHLAPDGVLLYNADMRHKEYVQDYARVRGVSSLSYGYGAEADYRVTSEEASDVRDQIHQVVQVETPKASTELHIPAFGRTHTYANVAALAAGEALGRDHQEMVRNVRSYIPSATAEKVTRVSDTARGARHLLVDGTFSATLESMENAMKLAADVHKRGFQRPGDLVAVLARVVALGEQAHTAHARLVHPLKDGGFTRVYTYGPDLEGLVAALQKENLHAGHFDSTETLAARVLEESSDGSTILLKGSKRAADFRDIQRQLSHHLQGGAHGVRITVTGEVQGVGFRRWAKEQAEIYNLTGWVRNRGDKVEIEAHGPRADLGQFVLACQEGPGSAGVTRVSFRAATRDAPGGFKVRPSTNTGGSGQRSRVSINRPKVSDSTVQGSARVGKGARRLVRRIFPGDSPSK